jgi:hypothetical protein
MAGGNRQNDELREWLLDLNRGGVSSLVYTTVHDQLTGETSYIDGNGNRVSEADYKAQQTAYAAVAAMPEVSAEEILQVQSDDEMVGLDVHDDHESDEGDQSEEEDEGEGSGDGEGDQDAAMQMDTWLDQEDQGDQKDDTEDEEDGEEGSKGGKTTLPRSKRWSEITGWRKFLRGEKLRQCPDDIDQLVLDAEKAAGKELKKSYRDRVLELKSLGFNDKIIELAKAQSEIDQLQLKLDKTIKQVKKYKAEIAKLKTTTATPEKIKAKKTSTPQLTPTKALDLPAPMQFRPTMTAPMSVMTYTTLPDTIIDTGVSMVRAAGEKGWPDRAKDWVALAESRPRLEYK